MSRYRQPGEPIGYVEWGGTSRAELLGVGRWRVTHDGREDPRAAKVFALHYAGWDAHPRLQYGQGILADLAKSMGGTFVFNAPEPAPPGVVHRVTCVGSRSS